MPDLNYPIKVLYEYYTCCHETPKRCRKRAMFYMDGQGYCLEHVHTVPDMLRGMLRNIVYRVAR